MTTNKIKINVDQKNKELHVDTHPFYVHRSKSEEVQWILSPATPFTVEFTEGSPFQETVFDNKMDHTGLPRQNAPEDRLYTATVTIPGIGACMIQGGVKP